MVLGRPACQTVEGPWAMYVKCTQKFKNALDSVGWWNCVGCSPYRTGLSGRCRTGSDGLNFPGGQEVGSSNLSSPTVEELPFRTGFAGLSPEVTVLMSRNRRDLCQSLRTRHQGGSPPFGGKMFPMEWCCRSAGRPAVVDAKGGTYNWVDRSNLDTITSPIGAAFMYLRSEKSSFDSALHVRFCYLLLLDRLISASTSRRHRRRTRAISRISFNQPDALT